MGIFKMWFHLFFVAAFIALGSCRGHYSVDRSSAEDDDADETCVGKYCFCTCFLQDCPPCPAPIGSKCLTSCGSPECPCPPKGGVSRPAVLSGKRSQLEEPVNKAAFISTVSVYPTGPICSAFHILPHVVVTMSSCISRQKAEDLFVTVNDYSQYFTDTQPLDVKDIIHYPYGDTFVHPVVLLLEKPSVKVAYVAVPFFPIKPTVPAEISKWYVNDEFYREYSPLRTNVSSHQNCEDSSRKEFVCATLRSRVRMGWNDVGTILIEKLENGIVAEGIYMGHNLYESITTVKYLSLYPYSSWLYHVIQQYPE